MNDIRPCGNNEKWCESCVSKGKCNYTKNQDIIAEFEKIKKKIEQDALKDVNGSKYIFVNRVNQIIDNYKAELKGE